MYRSLAQAIAFTSFSATLPRMSSAAMAGTKVSEAMKAPPSASITVIAIGENILPSTPEKVSSGANTRKMIIWPKMVGLIISRLASIVSWSRS